MMMHDDLEERTKLDTASHMLSVSEEEELLMVITIVMVMLMLS